jgi:pimeloyl-ACP methyl ester carboxylesterase
LEAPSLEDAVGDVGRAYRKFAEQTRSDRHALAAAIIGQREVIPAERLTELRLPMLIAVGAKDKVAGSPDALAALIPGAEVFVIPNRDHMLATGDKGYKAAVLDFLGRHE